MITLRCFLAHSKDTADEEIDRLCKLVEAALTWQVAKANGNSKVVVISGRDDFNARAAACGGWHPWSLSVGSGVDYIDGALRPVFDLYVVPGAVVSKATADILNAALKNNKPVFYLPTDDEAGRLYPVNMLTKRDTEGFKNTHALQFASEPLPL